VDVQLIQLALLFFLIAVFYSSAGFGGGSSYLAVLALFAIPFTQLRLIALMCNIAVVSGSVFLMWKNGYLQVRRLLPLLFFSIPMAYLGGRFRLEESTFFIILGFTLLLASLVMLFIQRKDENSDVKKLSRYSNGIIGGGIGFLSGIVGIGGGIFLSPILHFTKWAKIKTIAATTALFILVNSMAGITGQIMTYGFDIPLNYAVVLVGVVILGGQIGVRLTINWLSPLWVKRITALLILIVALRLLVKYL